MWKRFVIPEGSVLGKSIGLPLFFAGIALLVWNEVHHVHVNKLFDEARSSLTIVTDTVTRDAANEGRMIYMDAWALVGAPAYDDLYGTGGDYLTVRRKVEYKQWVEHRRDVRTKDSDGNTRTKTYYDYSQEWTLEPVNSSDFHKSGHDNYVLVQIPQFKAYSRGASFGPYKLSHELLDSALALPHWAVSLDTRSAKFLAAMDSTSHDGSVKWEVSGDTIYYCNVPGLHLLGDVRVTFEYAPSCHACVMAQPRGEELHPFQASDGYWYTFARFHPQAFDPAEAIDFEVWGNKWLVWSLRVIGWLMLVGALHNMLDWVFGFLNRVPVLGWGARAVESVVSWVLGTVIALIVIAGTLLFLHPLIGAVILGALALGYWLLRHCFRHSDAVLPPPLKPE